MNWQQVCEDKNLANLPYKLELNQWGQIVMSPVDYQHSSFQGEIIRWLNDLLPNGRAIPECAVETVEKTKVPDVVWISPERQEQVRGHASCPIAPEICAEILSPSNPLAEMLGTAEQPGKRELYFQAGAVEFWLCDEKGRIAVLQCARRSADVGPLPGVPQKSLVVCLILPGVRWQRRKAQA